MSMKEGGTRCPGQWRVKLVEAGESSVRLMNRLVKLVNCLVKL